jgi:hypothetical protein
MEYSLSSSYSNALSTERVDPVWTLSVPQNHESNKVSAHQVHSPPRPSFNSQPSNLNLVIPAFFPMDVFALGDAPDIDVVSSSACSAPQFHSYSIDADPELKYDDTNSVTTEQVNETPSNQNENNGSDIIMVSECNSSGETSESASPSPSPNPSPLSILTVNGVNNNISSSYSAICMSCRIRKSKELFPLKQWKHNTATRRKCTECFMKVKPICPSSAPAALLHTSIIPVPPLSSDSSCSSSLAVSVVPPAPIDGPCAAVPVKSNQIVRIFDSTVDDKWRYVIGRDQKTIMLIKFACYRLYTHTKFPHIHIMIC